MEDLGSWPWCLTSPYSPASLSSVGGDGAVLLQRESVSFPPRWPQMAARCPPEFPPAACSGAGRLSCDLWPGLRTQLSYPAPPALLWPDSDFPGKCVSREAWGGHTSRPLPPPPAPAQEAWSPWSKAGLTALNTNHGPFPGRRTGRGAEALGFLNLGDGALPEDTNRLSRPRSSRGF